MYTGSKTTPYNLILQFPVYLNERRLCKGGPETCDSLGIEVGFRETREVNYPNCNEKADEAAKYTAE